MGKEVEPRVAQTSGVVISQLDYHLGVYKVGIRKGEVSPKANRDGREVER